MSLIRVGCAAACLIVSAGAGWAEDAAAPERSARIGALSGTVSARGAGQSQWLAAVTDRVLAAGDGVWTQPGAQAQLELGGGAVALQEKSQLELVVLSGVDTELRLVQGEIELTVPSLGAGEHCQIDTPRGVVRVMQSGRFVIEAGAGEQPTRVTAFAGIVQIVGTESGLIVGSGQTGVVTGVDGGLSYAVQQAAIPAETAAVPPEPTPASSAPASASSPPVAAPPAASPPVPTPEQ
jgi:ferric-dicitrate binding protein FerR (iron transport regulator)